jgi:spermidine/putrescine transport system ATP-binding protein
MEKVIVKLENVTKKFDDRVIIKNLSLDIYEGEFITLLGPSGCGKTTILRMISGLEKVTDGKVYIEDQDVTDVEPTNRPVNTIFQNFALFPYMTVYDNVNFGLKMKKVPKEEADKRIRKAIKLVKLEGFEDRYPPQLSGGQQQRVAIARGIVMNHNVLLLDESLCSLDLKLKREMQIELKKLQKQLGMTFIYVTHDQDEALTMSDRIAIINKGVIEQLDSPKNIYRYPKTAFVADFIGESNIMKVKVLDIIKDRALINILEDLEFSIKNNDYKKGDTIQLLFRPETFEIHKEYVKNSIPGIVKDYIYDGQFTKLEIEVGKEKPITLKVTVSDADLCHKDDEIYLSVPEEKIVIIGDQNEEE